MNATQNREILDARRRALELEVEQLDLVAERRTLTPAETERRIIADAAAIALYLETLPAAGDTVFVFDELVREVDWNTEYTVVRRLRNRQTGKIHFHLGHPSKPGMVFDASNVDVYSVADRDNLDS